MTWLYRARFLSLLAGIFFALSVQAAAQDARAIVTQIDRLADADFRVRQQAAQQLLDMGSAALPLLRNNRSHPDAEVRRRLDELIQKLERDAALAPRLITLHVSKKPLEEIVGELARQSGYKIPTSGQPLNSAAGKGLYSFDFDRLRFWEALDRVCDAGGMSAHSSNDEMLRLSFQENYVPYRSYDGIFKVVATGFNYYLNTNFGQLPRNPLQSGPNSFESLQANFIIMAEPRMPILKAGMIRLREALDSQGHSMIMADHRAMVASSWFSGRTPVNNMRTYMQSASVNLSWPAKSSRTVSVLKGTIPITLLVEKKPTVVTDKIMLAQGKKFNVGTTSFQIDKIERRNSHQYEFKMSYNDDNAEHNWDYGNIYSLQHRLELQDAKGGKCSSYINWTTFNSPTNAQFVLVANRGGLNKAEPPARLVYHVWVQMDQDVEFEFRDLPLP
jgi:hypothetical protein